MKKIQEDGDDDFSFALPKLSRFRANVFRQRGSLAAIIRIITFNLPDYEQLHLPRTIIDVAKMTKGMVLVTGPAGSGKSTTLACIINEINRTRNAHVITLEDPIEYLHRHDRSVVSQREIGTDTESYVSGLRAALRQAPDVILLGEMRDYETIKTAMTAAETGHLVISTLHTIGAANTIDRIIDSFPPEQQQQIRVQISMVMEGVISQQLIPALNGGVHPAFEIMFCNNAIRNMCVITFLRSDTPYPNNFLVHVELSFTLIDLPETAIFNVCIFPLEHLILAVAVFLFAPMVAVFFLTFISGIWKEKIIFFPDILCTLK